jgi:hypothetical protein
LITNLPKIKQFIEDYIPTKKKELKKLLECLEDKHTTPELIDFLQGQYTVNQFNYLYNISLNKEQINFLIHLLKTTNITIYDFKKIYPYYATFDEIESTININLLDVFSYYFNWFALLILLLTSLIIFIYIITLTFTQQFSIEANSIYKFIIIFIIYFFGLFLSINQLRNYKTAKRIENILKKQLINLSST